MASNLSRQPHPSVVRDTSRALDRTQALAAVAAEDIAVLHEVGREIRRGLAQGALERRAIEQVIPELSTSLEYLDNSLLLASIARVQRLARDL